MKAYTVKLSGGWEGTIYASGVEEARYHVKKTAQMLLARVLFVGEAKGGK